MQIGYRRDPAHKAEPEHWAAASAGLRAGGAADMAGSPGATQDVVMYAGSHGALLGAVEVCCTTTNLFAIHLTDRQPFPAWTVWGDPPVNLPAASASLTVPDECCQACMSHAVWRLA